MFGIGSAGRAPPSDDGCRPEPPHLPVAAVLLGIYCWEVYQDRTEPSEEAQLRQAYTNGEIGEAELERRLAYHLDDRNAEIVRWLDDNVENVAETKGKALAKHFDSLDAMRRADHEALTAVHGIGESTAAAIQRAFDAEDEESVA